MKFGKYMKKDLTDREEQIVTLLAWGAAIKEVADDLQISYKTVDNTLQKVYKKLRVGKLNELSAWYFCTHFHISMDLSPIKRSVGAIVLLFIFSFGEIEHASPVFRARRCRNRIEESRKIKSYED
jgi:DNA-binding CsgD family transcriptional regulator